MTAARRGRDLPTGVERWAWTCSASRAPSTSCPGPACARAATRARANAAPPGLAKGAPWLKTTLIQAAWAAVRSKDSYLRTSFHRLKARRGTMKATVAVAASMLRSAYYMLSRRMPYHDLGPAHFDSRNRTRTASHLLKRLKELGIEVVQTRISQPPLETVSFQDAVDRRDLSRVIAATSHRTSSRPLCGISLRVTAEMRDRSAPMVSSLLWSEAGENRESHEHYRDREYYGNPWEIALGQRGRVRCTLEWSRTRKSSERCRSRSCARRAARLPSRSSWQDGSARASRSHTAP
jgi:hypothetical protein